MDFSVKAIIYLIIFIMLIYRYSKHYLFNKRSYYCKLNGFQSLSQFTLFRRDMIQIYFS